VYFGIRILVQSERHPTYLEERVEAFLDFIKSKLEAMADGEFLEQKTGLERKWREGAKNLVEETNRYWTHIESGVFDFHHRVYFDLLASEVFTNTRSFRGQRRRYAEGCDERGSAVTFLIERTPIILPEGQALCPLCLSQAPTQEALVGGTLRGGWYAGEAWDHAAYRLDG